MSYMYGYAVQDIAAGLCQTNGMDTHTAHTHVTTHTHTRVSRVVGVRVGVPARDRAPQTGRKAVARHVPYVGVKRVKRYKVKNYYKVSKE